MSEVSVFTLNDADNTPKTLMESWNDIIRSAHQTGAKYIQIRTDDDPPRIITAFKIYTGDERLDDHSIIGQWDWDILTANMWEAIKACANDIVLHINNGIGERTTLINNVTHDVLDNSGDHRIIEVIIQTDYVSSNPQWQIIQVPEDMEVVTF